MLGTLAVLLLAALLTAGQPYLRGLAVTTLGRHSGSFPAPGILFLSGKWLWPVALLAALGVLAAVTARCEPQVAALVIVLAAAVLLAPVEQARIHTYTSLFKHGAYGAWFGCAAAGYALAALSRVVPQVKTIAAFRAGVVMTAVAALPAIPAAGQQYSWPNSALLVGQLQRIIAAYPGPVLADDGGDLLHFYLGRQVGAMPVVGTWYISYRHPGEARPQTGLAGYADAIGHRYFAVVLLEFVDNLTIDYRIERLLAVSGKYRPVVSIPYPVSGGTREFMVWVRRTIP
jgi:hypothetical protein